MQEIIGTSNRILEINLSDETAREYTVTNEERTMYLGGKGLGLKLLYDRMEPGTDPLGEDNMIAFMMGVYMSTTAPCSARFSAITKSPLTGIMTHSSCGGPFGESLKTAGYDGLIVRGKAKNKTYLVISSSGVEFKKADKLWGKGSIDTQAALNKEIPGSAAVCIGQAGETINLFANVISGERYLGRGGMGAVMGAKNLKAVVAIGKAYKVIPKNGKKFERARKRAMNYLKNSAPVDNYKQFGTNANTMPDNEAWILPVNNFTKGRHDEAYKLSGEFFKDEYSTKYHTCKRCQILCGKMGTFNGKELPLPEFETTVLLGSNIGIFDQAQIADWNRICGDMGMDTISAGGTIAWVMEAAQKGLVKSDLKFGSPQGVSQALKDMALGKGFGKEMAMGSRSLSRKYGGESFAIQVKGMEMPAYDPRGVWGHGLSYATANRGACHLSTSMMVLEAFFNMVKPYNTSAKPTLVKYFENLYSAVNSLHTCQFTAFAYTLQPPLVKFSPVPVLRQLMTYLPKVALMAMDVATWSRLWSGITGLRLNQWQMLKAGERIHVLERYMNTLEGISRKDDTLPERMLTEGRECDPKGMTVPLHKMLDSYYRERGFDKNGIPTDRLLKKLGIKKK
ncbi:MAG: aldehyde ferredoxin oxidoreductase [Spirochaetae bacterium HGW-Spirochaetae-1]|jgi:aldehyde:ferredoxin oxidoreductase|nr:MAG: aldehyde ferredoxin oxidoreductase [Spirochaetae bacterium HGW-Spirochaetae-1]